MSIILIVTVVTIHGGSAPVQSATQVTNFVPDVHAAENISLDKFQFESGFQSTYLSGRIIPQVQSIGCLDKPSLFVDSGRFQLRNVVHKVLIIDGHKIEDLCCYSFYSLS